MAELRIFACRPVDEAEMKRVAPDLEVPPIYPGSEKGRCQICETDVWIGPKVQEAMEELEGTLACFFCVGAIANAEQAEVRDLGNTFERKP